MALTGTDLLVVQQQTGNKDVKSLSITDLSSYLATQSPLNFKGSANMTVQGDEPAAEDRVAGNVYINNATSTGTVQPNAQAVWQDTLGWQVFSNSSASIGVESIGNALPITVNSDNAATPVVGVNAATTTTSGVVTLATADDITVGTTGKVATAAQLKATNEAISDAGGGTVLEVTGEAPIVITGTATTTPKVTITAATTSDPGSVVLEDASALDVDSTSTAATPAYVAGFYLVKDFSSLDDVNA